MSGLFGGAAGLGLDVVEISRVRSVAARNPRFLKRVFSSREIAYCSTKRRKWQHFAVRFAAKEAVWKALSGGEAPPPGGRVSLKDIEVRRGPDGRPGVAVRGKEMPQILLSLSHGERQAVAVALVLKTKRRGGA